VIRDPYDGSILGVVDVSGLSASYSRHSLALVVATAGRIENRLAKIELGIRYRLLEGCVDRLSGTSADGIIVFDRRGRAIKANGRASAALADLGIGELAVAPTVWPPCPCPGRRGGEHRMSGPNGCARNGWSR
jgi:transcriptional regulator of acetoin/glycerol metabolism